MGIRKLGNSKFHKQGSQTRESVHDLNSQVLLAEILIELRMMNTYFKIITDEEITSDDILGEE